MVDRLTWVRLAMVLSSMVVVACDAPRTEDAGPGGADAGAFDGGDRDAGAPGEDGGTMGDDGAVHDAGPPDAGPEPCSEPGAVEHVPCGMCGTVERFCQSTGIWAYGDCTGQGECVPGSLETTACGNCGAQTRRCTTACAWDLVGACEGEGECAPGAMTTTEEGCPANQARELLCNATCTFEESRACAAERCTTPGTTETSLPCGSMCGTRDRFCTSANEWDYSECTGEGVCVPGTTGTLPCGMCGTKPARCTAECG